MAAKKQGKKHEQKTSLSIEAHAKKFHSYHPVIKRVFFQLYRENKEFFHELFNSRDDCALFFSSMENARVWVLKSKSLPSGRRKKKGMKRSRTPCFMVANNAVWASGVLNKPGRHSGNTFDLTTIEGFVYLMHEIYHNMQWYRSPLKLIYQYIKGVVHSIATSRNHLVWAHEAIDFEVEAIKFHLRLWRHVEKNEKLKRFLEIFKDYQ
ncbi:MAG: hypothetical protein ACTSVI_04755 [Promethearchaeota archaeon]